MDREDGVAENEVMEITQQHGSVDILRSYSHEGMVLLRKVLQPYHMHLVGLPYIDPMMRFCHIVRC